MNDAGGYNVQGRQPGSKRSTKALAGNKIWHPDTKMNTKGFWKGGVRKLTT